MNVRNAEPREFAVRSTEPRNRFGVPGARRGSFVGYPKSRVPRHLVPWPGRAIGAFCEQEGFSGAPYLIIYRGRTILIPAARPAKCHGGIKHCLPIGAARTRTRARSRSLYLEPCDIQCRTAIVIYAPPCRPPRTLPRSLGPSRPFQRDRATWNKRARPLNFAILLPSLVPD